VKVLVADPFEQSGLDGLAAAGCEVVHDPTLKDEALASALAETRADVLVVRSTKVSAAMLDGASLGLIVRAGAGYNTIDVAAASAQGIYVSNCPGRNAVAVAELALGLILSLDRRIPDNVADLRAGHWDKKAYGQARGLAGSTLGLVGFGSIGQEVARRAQAFGLHLVIWSRRFEAGARFDPADHGLEPSRPDLQVRAAGSLAEVAEAADILSIHLALSEATRGIIGRELIGRLRPGAFFINTARAELVDYAALAEAISGRGIRAGLDVFPDEPASPTGEFGDPIVSLPGVYGTHHIGASTDQAQEAIAAETVRIIDAFQRTGQVPNVVNLARRTPASHRLVIRHRDRPGVLAHVFDVLRRAEINVQETENVVFEGAQAAIARINLDRAPTPDELGAIQSGNDNILSVQLVSL
jgi:D-3-phosphoglycerate dehydrogenase / 2-oxoglutarate reductase